ncbi:hypothetical protein NP568_25975, partial [Vibrio parahaemolyticus]|nr:hypothetical protein [Vibrio parahaemolyticus]
KRQLTIVGVNSSRHKRIHVAVREISCDLVCGALEKTTLSQILTIKKAPTKNKSALLFFFF